MTTLLVASGGGHLAQLLFLLPRMDLVDDVVWAVPASGLSRDRIAAESLVEIPYLQARDWRGATKMLATARRIIRDTGATRIISTGAAPAPPFFLAGRQMGLDLHYIETATRSQGPSLSGRLVSKLPGVHLYTQYPHLADARWHFAGSIFDPFTAVADDRVLVGAGEGPAATAPIRRVVVSLGTEGFGFRRAVEALIDVLPPDAEVLWQTGATDVSGLPITGHETVPAAQLRSAIADSDLFICHAGTGSALTAFELGKRPLLLPREARFGEHVDDHQHLTAAELVRRGLAVTTRVSDIRPEHLALAGAARVVSDSTNRPFELIGVQRRPITVIDLRTTKSDGLERATAQLPAQ